MNTNILNWITKSFKYILLAGALLYIIIYFFVVFSRIGYPFELNWQEGSSVDHVRWILSGNKYYVSPSLDFVPSVYTPVYFHLSALISTMTGIGFLPLRLVSFLSSIGCFLVIFLIVKKETNSKFSGVLAASLFAASFRISGAWFDVARVDILFLFFLLTALYFVRFGTSAKSYILAGVFISLSFLTKQTALIISLPLMLASIFINRRHSIFFIGTTVAIIGGSTLLLNYIYDGWYYYYVFELPRSTPYVPFGKTMFTNFWLNDIKAPLSIACIISAFYLLSRLLDSDKKFFLFYLLASAGMLGASWSSRLHHGSNENVLFPAYALISILFGMGLHTFFSLIKSIPADKQGVLKLFIYFICILQFSSGYLWYNPFDQIPTQKDLEAGRKFISAISQIKGEVFVPFHGYLPVLAGKKSYAHPMGMQDVMMSSIKKELRDKLGNEITQAIRGKRFAAVIVNSKREKVWIPPDIEKYYQKKGMVFDDNTVFFPVTGMKTRPEYIYVPKDTAGTIN